MVEDVYGKNALDYACQQNAIECLKHLVSLFKNVPQIKTYSIIRAILYLVKNKVKIEDTIIQKIVLPQLWQDKLPMFGKNQSTVGIWQAEIHQLT